MSKARKGSMALKNRNPNVESEYLAPAGLAFGFWASGFFRFSDIALRVYKSGLFRAIWIAKLPETIETLNHVNGC
jgi:hypothetical protein